MEKKQNARKRYDSMAGFKKLYGRVKIYVIMILVTKMIKNMVTVHSSGMMVGNMLEIGRKANKMVEVFLLNPQEKVEKENGKMEEELDG
jgi:hypothetical protein